ncbi:MAG: chromate transporter [Ruminococcaceae bacterium]|nr:chromate transporter [Oscillospiraceae bacterium]
MAYLELFLTFFTIGIVTFGGGYAMLPMIQSEVAARWGELISESSLINFVAVSESTPGPFAINMATYVGSVVGRDAGGDFLASMLGSFCATMGVVLPSFIVILIVAKCYDRFKQSSLVKGAMSGLKPAVVGLIANAVLKVVRQVLIPSGFAWSIFSTSAFWISAGLFAVMAVLAFKKVHPIIIICISAAAGILFGCLGWL